MKSVIDRRAFLGLAARWFCAVGVWLCVPAASFAAPPDPERTEAGPRPRFQAPEYSYPFGPDPEYVDRTEALARRKIHDAVSEAIDRLLEAEQKDVPPDKLRQLKEKLAKDYEQILKREFLLFDDP